MRTVTSGWVISVGVWRTSANDGVARFKGQYKAFGRSSAGGLLGVL